jgi:hypothetical protein
MAACVKYGRIEELAKEMGEKAKMALWSPASLFVERFVE